MDARRALAPAKEPTDSELDGLARALEKELYQINNNIAEGEHELGDIEKDSAIFQLEEEMMAVAAEQDGLTYQGHIQDETHPPQGRSFESEPSVNRNVPVAQPEEEYRQAKKAKSRNHEFPALPQANPVPQKR